LRHRGVELLTAPEIGRNRYSVAGARVRAGERRTAELRVEPHRVLSHSPDLGRALAVPELPDVEVSTAPIDPLVRGQPAEQNIAGSLHQSLSFDDSPALVLVPAATRERSEDRGTSLLDLEKER